ncbi:MAG: quinolinate synthase NadA [Eubacteriales bacterium]|nr:quinolinate synthase NadA [Eubacteriales bacterium]
MDSIYQEIEALKKKNNAVILAHYYVPDEVQACADHIGDSFYLSKAAVGLDADMIVFAGVTFMGESAKILNPGKTVLMPEPGADCPMAHMADPEKIRELRGKYPDLAVVCYINSTAELKTYADICVTSANAVKIVKGLPNKHIYFIPDRNLGSYVAGQVPEKDIILNDGCCYVHKEVTPQQVQKVKEEHPKAEFLVHPECCQEVLALADFVGSTSEIISYASQSKGQEFIIGTENGVMYELRQKNPDKIFYPVAGGQICSGMKSVTLEKVRDCLKYHTGEILVDEELRRRAYSSLNRMLESGV